MYELIYTSVAKKSFSDDDLLALLNKARENNTARGITGMLIYDNGEFLQLLEGDKQEVESLYQRISGDGRHKSVQFFSVEK